MGEKVTRVLLDRILDLDISIFQGGRKGRRDYLPETATPIIPSLEISRILLSPEDLARERIIGCSSIASNRPFIRKLSKVVFWVVEMGIGFRACSWGISEAM